MKTIPWTEAVATNEVHVPFLATRAYLALQLLQVEGSQDELPTALLQALKRKAWQNAPRLVEMALSGMPDAVVPFRRHPHDILVAACVVEDRETSYLDGEGNALSVGYFRIARKTVDYIDTGHRQVSVGGELANPQHVQLVLARHAHWVRLPEVEVGDLGRGELLRVRLGAPGLVPTSLSARTGSLRAHRPTRVPGHPGNRSAECELTVYATTGWRDPQAMDDARRTGVREPHEALRRLARLRAQASMEGEIVRISDVAPEQLMELHAASLDVHDTSADADRAASAWLHIRFDDDEGLFPLPDLMETGAISGGWWSPGVHLGSPKPLSVALNDPSPATVWVPESTAWRLMARFPWVRAPDPVAWIHWAEAVKERDAPGAIWPPAQRAVAASADSATPRKTSKSGKRAKPAAASTSAPGCMPIDPTCIVHADAPPT